MNRTVLPVPRPRLPIAPSVDRTHQDPAYPVRERVSPPKGAPNVLVVLVDDMGFGASSAYGGPCRMPTAERLAAGGLSYTRFHTTAICAPTRVSLLSGRNHHGAGMGTVPEMATSSPGYDCIRPESMATLPQILSGNGYLTGAFGKMHQTPMWEVGETGPFDRWPLNEGFDRFYGFIGAETNQFTPALIDGFTPIEPPRTPEEGYHLSEDLVDQAATWIETISALEPDRPWFTYLSFGACHDPCTFRSHGGVATAASSRGAGTLSGRRPWRSRSSWVWCHRTRRCRRSIRTCPTGQTSATTSASCASG